MGPRDQGPEPSVTMESRVLVVLGLVMALVLPSLALDDEEPILMEQCNLHYQSRRVCVPDVPKLDKKYCLRFRCCWDPEAPSNALSCFQPRNENDESLFRAHPALRGKDS